MHFFLHCTYTALLQNLKQQACALFSAGGFVDYITMTRVFGLNCMILQPFQVNKNRSFLMTHLSVCIELSNQIQRKYQLKCMNS